MPERQKKVKREKPSRARRRGRNQGCGMAILAMNITGRTPVPRRVFQQGHALMSARSQRVCQPAKRVRSFSQCRSHGSKGRKKIGQPRRGRHLGFPQAKQYRGAKPSPGGAGRRPWRGSEGKSINAAFLPRLRHGLNDRARFAGFQLAVRTAVPARREMFANWTRNYCAVNGRQRASLPLESGARVKSHGMAERRR